MATKTVRAWRPFTARDRKLIESRLHAEDGSRCPRCGDILEVRPLVRSVAAPDLECRECKRYYARPLTAAPEIMYLLRIQRLATAVLRV